MFPILQAQWIAPQVRRLVLRAPRIARKQQPGQFVIVRVHEHGERIPLTIVESAAEAGTITLIVQTAGKTTDLLNRLEPGQAVLDVVGPLGRPSEIPAAGRVAVIGGGVGAAIALPVARAMQAAGCQVLGILGARTRELLILEAELGACCDPLLVATDDGSRGRRGLVTDCLREWLEAGNLLDYVLAIGPIRMMQGVAEVTRPRGIPTVASLNALMVDGTGMCGGCRVLVGGQTRFACVDGPEFDAHQVDFEVLAQRNAAYRDAERQAWEAFRADPAADLARVAEQCSLAREHPELAS